MSELALKVIQENIEQFDQLKNAQQRLERARNDYEDGRISRNDYIELTEDCIKTIRNISISAKPLR